MQNALTHDLYLRIAQWCYELARKRIEGTLKIRVHPTTWSAMLRQEITHYPLRPDGPPFGGAMLQWELWQDPRCPRRVGGKAPTDNYEEDLRELALEALAQQPYYAELIIQI